MRRILDLTPRTRKTAKNIIWTPADKEKLVAAIAQKWVEKHHSTELLAGDEYELIRILREIQEDVLPGKARTIQGPTKCPWLFNAVQEVLENTYLIDPPIENGAVEAEAEIISEEPPSTPTDNDIRYELIMDSIGRLSESVHKMLTTQQLQSDAIDDVIGVVNALHGDVRNMQAIIAPKKEDIAPPPKYIIKTPKVDPVKIVVAGLDHQTQPDHVRRALTDSGLIDLIKLQFIGPEYGVSHLGNLDMLVYMKHIPLRWAQAARQKYKKSAVKATGIKHIIGLITTFVVDHFKIEMEE